MHPRMFEATQPMFNPERARNINNLLARSG
jgi:hypothetical protein